MLKRWFRKAFESRGYAVFNTRAADCYAQDSLFTYNNDHFRDDPAFRDAYARGVAANGGVDPHNEWRVHVALWAARAAMRVPGDFVECGVNAGLISSAILQRLNWTEAQKRFHLIDTFQGPVLGQFTPGEVAGGRLDAAKDAMARGAYVTDLDRIRANYAEWGNVEIIQGAVPEVLGGAGIERAAFLHLDMNCAYPERAALEHFWPLLSPGAIVLLDDYAYFGNEDLACAIDSAAASLGTEVLSLPTGQGMIVR